MLARVMDSHLLELFPPEAYLSPVTSVYEYSLEGKQSLNFLSEQLELPTYVVETTSSNTS